MVGFDMYHSEPKENDSWFQGLADELDVVGSFAKKHGKLMAVTETGMATLGADKGDNQTACHKTGNKVKDWYEKVMNTVSKSSASYFLLWANFAENDGFYTPYVKAVNDDGSLYGHELLDYFIDFYNDGRSIFSANQIDALKDLKDLDVTVHSVSDKATGYFTAPASGSRILSPTTLVAKVSNLSTADNVSFTVYGADGYEKTIAALPTSASTYSAELDAETLEALGTYIGKITLNISGSIVDTINATFNIPEPVEDPNVVDDFEQYYGEKSLLDKKWSPMKAAGCTLDLSLVKSADYSYDGSYGLSLIHISEPTRPY